MNAIPSNTPGHGERCQQTQRSSQLGNDIPPAPPDDPGGAPYSQPMAHALRRERLDFEGAISEKERFDGCGGNIMPYYGEGAT